MKKQREKTDESSIPKVSEGQSRLVGLVDTKNCMPKKVICVILTAVGTVLEMQCITSAASTLVKLVGP